jgi:hypothetical protein
LSGAILNGSRKDFHHGCGGQLRVGKFTSRARGWSRPKILVNCRAVKLALVYSSRPTPTMIQLEIYFPSIVFLVRCSQAQDQGGFHSADKTSKKRKRNSLLGFKADFSHIFSTMGREEQIEEREVLDSIFPEEITGEFTPPSTHQANKGRPRTLTFCAAQTSPRPSSEYQSSWRYQKKMATLPP